MEDFMPLFLSNDYVESDIISNNGFIFGEVFLPEEIVLHILSFVEVNNLLKYSLVCRQWNKFIKSNTIWTTIYKRIRNCKIKHLPWYLYYSFLTTNYFDTNLLSFDNRQALQYWCNHTRTNERSSICDYENISVMILKAHMERNTIVPCCIPRIYKQLWLFRFTSNRLFRYIIDRFKPHIYLRSCGAIYELQCGMFNEAVDSETADINYRCGMPLRQDETYGQRTKFEEVELTVHSYPKGLRGIAFESTTFNGYTKSLPDGVLMFLFDSIENLDPKNSSCNAVTNEILCHWAVLPSTT